MKILLTGSTGFIGSHILDELLKIFMPSDLALFVRNPKIINRNSIHQNNIFLGDITDLNSIIRSVNAFEPEIIIHTAALTDDWAPLSELMKINAEGTRNIIKALKIYNKKCFLVHISSSGVYKRVQSKVLTEESPLKPSDNYQKSKLVAERIILDAMSHKECEGVILRPPNVMGPRDLTQMAKICQAIKNRKFPLINNGKARHAWISAQDLTQGVILSFQKSNLSKNKIYNLYSFDLTVSELFNNIINVLGINFKPKNYSYHIAYLAGLIGEIIAKIKQKPSTLNRYRVKKFAIDRLYNDSKIRLELGYKPQKTAYETIKETVNWLQTQGLV